MIHSALATDRIYNVGEFEETKDRCKLELLTRIYTEVLDGQGSSDTDYLASDLRFVQVVALDYRLVLDSVACAKEDTVNFLTEESL